MSMRVLPSPTELEGKLARLLGQNNYANWTLGIHWGTGFPSDVTQRTRTRTFAFNQFSAARLSVSVDSEVGDDAMLDGDVQRDSKRQSVMSW
jgi:hypothetical protein